MKNRRIPYPLYNALLCLLVTAAAALLCLCAKAAEDRYYLKLDLSDSGVSYLSDYTLSQLDRLEEKVNLFLIHTPGAEGSLRDLQLETLGKMTAVCPSVQFREVDPVTQLQQLSALAGETAGVKESTVFVQNEAATRTIRIEPDGFLFSRRLEDEIYTIYCGEARLIGAIGQVTTDNPVEAYFLTGHGEADAEACSSLALQLRAMGMEVHSGTAGIIQPEAGDVVLLIAPQSDLTQAEADRLKGFVDGGVHMVLSCGADTPFDTLPELERLCELYGVGFRPGWVVEHQAETERYVDRPELLSPRLSPENTLLDELPGRLILPRACALTAAQTRPGVTVQALLTTSSRAVLKKDTASDAYASSPEDVSGTMTMAQLAQCGEAELLLLSSADMLLDDAAVTGASVMDASENLSFVAACLAEMTDRGDGATLEAGVKQLPAQLITFDSEKTRQSVSAVIIAALPCLLLVLMAAVLVKRRRL